MHAVMCAVDTIGVRGCIRKCPTRLTCDFVATLLLDGDNSIACLAYHVCLSVCSTQGSIGSINLHETPIVLALMIGSSALDFRG